MIQMKVKLLFTYTLSSNLEVPMETGWGLPEDLLAIAEDLQHKNRGKNFEFIDELGVTWSKKELIKLQKKWEAEPTDITVYFDGTFQRDSLLAGLGVVIYYKKGPEQWRVRANQVVEQLTNNNEAEYAALKFGMQLLEDLGVKYQRCRIRGDSLVVLNQLSGEWPCYEDELHRWIERIEKKRKELSVQFQFEPIHRNKNKEADQLAKQAVEGKNIYSHSRIDT
jgi:ribonuclease HI